MPTTILTQLHFALRTISLAPTKILAQAPLRTPDSGLFLAPITILTLLHSALRTKNFLHIDTKTKQHLR